MSARGTFWAWRVGKRFDLSSTERLVLLRLADGSSEDTGECWYKQESIADATGLSRSGVQKALYSLAGRGLLEIERVTAEGRTLANTYRLVLTMEAPLLTSEAPVPLGGGGIPKKHGGASEVSSYTYPASGTEPALRKESARESRGGSVRATKSRKKGKPEPEPLPELPASVNSPQVIEAWNDFVEMRRRNGCPVTVAAATRMFKRFEEWGPAKTQALISKSIELGYRGVFDDDKIPNAPRRLESAKPSSPPVDYTLEEAKDAARQVVKDQILTAADGWSGSTRSIALDRISDAKDEHEVETARLAIQNLDSQLRNLGAYPLRPPKMGEFEPGILTSKSGGRWRVEWTEMWGGKFLVAPQPVDADPMPDTQDHEPDCECTACVADYDPWQIDGCEEATVGRERCATCGEPEPDYPESLSDEGECRRCSLGERGSGPGINATCSDGGRHDWEPSGKCGRCDEKIGGESYSGPSLDAIHPNPRDPYWTETDLDNAVAFCMNESFGDGPTVVKAEEDDNPDFGHGEDMVGDDTPLDAEWQPRRWRSTDPGMAENCSDGALHMPSLSQGGMVRCLRCGSPLEEVPADFCSRCGAPMIDDGAGGETCIRCERPEGPEPPTAQVVDLMAALKASLNAKGWKG